MERIMLSVEQPDLFGEDDAAETRRYYDALTCLADAYPNALEVLIGDRRPDTGETRARMTNPWAYWSDRAGYRFERVATWGGWYSRPRHMITWTELDQLVGHDPRIKEIRAWSQALTALDAWKDRYRPCELEPNPEMFHPSHAQTDHDRPGWPARLHAWQQTIAVYTEARAAIEATR